ncbi:MAG: helix-turn-helix transcriptional regulator [Lachnospiraceae bacterium]|nr:helix-turn-helix transcriptional regulator [Lachnospiraceae bacterium]
MPERDEEQINDIYIELGERVKIARKSFRKPGETPTAENIGLTQAELAALSKHTQSYISEIESGKARITVDVLKDLCDTLAVTPNQLLNYIEPPLTAEMAIALQRMSDGDRNKLLQLYDLMKQK